MAASFSRNQKKRHGRCWKEAETRAANLGGRYLYEAFYPSQMKLSKKDRVGSWRKEI